MVCDPAGVKARGRGEGTDAAVLLKAPLLVRLYARVIASVWLAENTRAGKSTARGNKPNIKITLT